MALVNCKECGQQISDSAASCPHCGAPVARESFCQRCGGKMPANATFCPHCGAPVSPDLRAPYEKDKIVAGLLAIFLGGLGIHYFYMGKTVAGILSIVFTLVSCGIWQVVMFIQGVLMLTMTDEAFRGKYIGNDSTFPLF